MAAQPSYMTPTDIAAQGPAGQQPAKNSGASVDLFSPEGMDVITGGAFSTARRGKELEQQRYEEQMARLRGLIGQTDQRFAPARAEQEAAVTALGQRAAGLAGGPAVQAVQAQREAAMGLATPQAILGGQIGAAQRGSMMGLEQEAAARQAAYLRGVQALGAGLMSEAEQRRAAEAEALQDIQTRYAAAQRFAAGELERQAQQRQGVLGGLMAFGGSLLGSAAGGGGKK